MTSAGTRGPGDPIEGDNYAFVFRVHEPRPDPTRGLLVLMHGVGADEMQLASVAEHVPDGVLVALPRADAARVAAAALSEQVAVTLR